MPPVVSPVSDQYCNASNLNARIALHVRFSVNPRGWYAWCFDLFRFATGARILELGCGPGNLWVKNADRTPAEWRILLVDTSLNMLRAARQQLGEDRRFAIAVADAQAIPLASVRFDGVIANHMLYHVPDRARALSEVHRVLRAGGRFYAATNGPGHMREIWELAQRFDGSIERGGAQEQFFDLRNGAAQLAPWFAEVRLHVYEDELHITAAEPLVGYIVSGSGNAASVLVGDKRREFTEFVENEIARKGAVRVTKSTGLFDAFRSEHP